jgi:hypothetical protein
MGGDDLRQNSLFSYLPAEEDSDQPSAAQAACVVSGIARSDERGVRRSTPTLGVPRSHPSSCSARCRCRFCTRCAANGSRWSKCTTTLLFRWFVDLTMDEWVSDASTFSVNSERLRNQTMAREFFIQVLALAQWHGRISDEHFSVDGTLIQAWASRQSFRPKDGGDEPPLRRCMQRLGRLQG